MKKLSFLTIAITIAFILKSCQAQQQQPLTPVSSETITVESKLSKEQVWDKLVDYMAVNGFNIKIIDKQSGLVVSEDYSFTNNQTHADKNGNIINPNAYVIVRDVKPAEYIMGQANIRIKDNSNGGSTVNVNIVNLRAHSIRYIYNGMYNPKKEVITYVPVASSNVFEKYLTKKISE
ncbi:MAG: hypothetical protein L0G39_23360 [Chryseobacterium sp.]|nr:hypothetical protein [Chryseobacterium sp.]